MPQQLRIGLIGTGRIGQVHAANIVASPATNLAWVADVVEDGAREVATLYGAHPTTRPSELILAADVDAILIASPTPTHVDLISAAIDAGKPVLCEKPIDLDISRVDALRSKAASSPVPITIGFNRRFDEQFAEIRRRTRNGEIGDLEQITIISRDSAVPSPAYVAASGGIFRDMTIHDLDMARFLLGEILDVTAVGANSFSKEIRDAGDYDSAVVMLRSESGAIATIVNSRHSAFGYDQRLEAFGSLGMLQATNVGTSGVRTSTASAVDARGPYQDFFLARYADAYRKELAAFVALARGETTESPTFEDGRRALQLADAAEESARTGRTVVLGSA